MLLRDVLPAVWSVAVALFVSLVSMLERLVFPVP
jgi:hypothetical protein